MSSYDSEKMQALFASTIAMQGISFEDDEQRKAAYEFFCFQQEGFRVFCRKNKQYGNSFKDVGAKGAFIEIHAKFRRLWTLVWGADPASILRNRGDIFQNSLDLANYAVILCICVLAGNVFGNEPTEL